MDNQFTRLDSYGRLIHVPEYPYSEPEAPEPMVAEEVWARTERVKRLEDTVIMLTDRVNQCDIRIRVLETSPLEELPKMSKSIGNIAEPPRERVCDSCKWGTINPHNDEKISCHHDPYFNTNTKDYWCSRWTEK